MAIQSSSATATHSEARSLGSLGSVVLDSLDVAVLVASRDGTIRYRNPRVASRLADGSHVSEVFAGARFLGPFDDWSPVLRRVFDEGCAVRFQCAMRPRDRSSPVLAALAVTPLREEGHDRVTGAVILIEEGIRQEAVEEKLEVSKRLTSLGKLATRVAHELNNPLDGILRYINLALRVTADVPNEKLKDYLTESRTGLIRMVQIIGELLEFSRTTGGEFDEMNINDVVEQAIKAGASGADAHGIVVAADFHRQDMPHTRGSRLYQVCCNLIKNAVDAMPHGGRLSITTGLVDQDVVIEVADTGVGLPDPPEKVFEPFFTTKEPGKGTGLGLAISKDYIDDMQGTITAKPGEDGGAVFTVRIPIRACHAPRRLGQAFDKTKSAE